MFINKIKETIFDLEDSSRLLSTSYLDKSSSRILLSSKGDLFPKIRISSEPFELYDLSSGSEYKDYSQALA